ncbi:MAG: 5'-3' exonuclease H3TH domain-containing protein, partial [Balneolaceae bacterium]
MQLVHDHIKMYKPDNKNGGFVLIDREGVKEYFGVYPEKVVDVLALIGDTSDNIPGVPGIGKKGAPKLINKYGSLENAIEAAPDMKSKRYREGLTQHADKARHAKKMVSIKTDVPDVVDWEELEWEGPDKKKLGLFFKKMEFRTLTRKYLIEDPDGQSDLFSTDGNSGRPEESLHQRMDPEAVNYELAVSSDEIREVVEEMKSVDRFCFDTETDSSDPMLASLVGISFSARPGTARYIPVNIEDALPENKVCELLEPLFDKNEKIKIAHNFKYDYIVLKRAGLNITGEAFDTMVAAYLLDAGQRLKMDSLAKKYLDYEPIPIGDLIGTGRKKKTMDEIPYKDILFYACEDADITLQLYEVLSEKLKEDELLEIAVD